MMLKVYKNKLATIILALFLAILLAGVPTIVPTAHAGGCTTHTSCST